MDYLSLFLIAIGLTFDTFAVSISAGFVASRLSFRQASQFALVLALFQAFMPFLGWFIGNQIKGLVIDYGHWVAFGILSVIGIKMIVESFKKEEDKKDIDPFNIIALIGIAIATSIDALIVGVSFAFINVDILLSIGIIGITTYIVSMLGLLFGRNAGKLFGRKMEIIGGLTLIGIGMKILVEHFYF
jgi:putative Mn2+ efflux pump MntP